jgi:hypothetical protein
MKCEESEEEEATHSKERQLQLSCFIEKGKPDGDSHMCLFTCILRHDFHVP